MLIRFEKENDQASKDLRTIYKDAQLEPDLNYTINEINQDIANKYKISIYPTMIMADDKLNEEGIYPEIQRYEGISNLEALKKFMCIDNWFYVSPEEFAELDLN